MTNEELKAALMSRKPVILDSPRYGKIRYKYVNAIRYTLDNAGKVIVQAELLDRNNNSVTIAKTSEVFYDE